MFRVETVEKSEAVIMLQFTFCIMIMVENRVLRRIFGPKSDEMI
jgi:hypothetical protein